MTFDKQKRQQFFNGLFVIIRLALGCLFLYSSLHKIRQPYDFLSDVYSYELVGPKLGMIVAMTLPWLELMVGISLIGGIFTGGALLASAAMGAMFTFVLSFALYRGLDITCGCFSSGGGLISYSTVIRASVILLLSIVAYIGTITLRPNQIITCKN